MPSPGFLLPRRVEVKGPDGQYTFLMEGQVVNQELDEIDPARSRDKLNFPI